jgi:hypothetical protein
MLVWRIGMLAGDCVVSDGSLRIYVGSVRRDVASLNAFVQTET